MIDLTSSYVWTQKKNNLFLYFIQSLDILNCSCHTCEPKDANNAKAEKGDKEKEGEAIQGASSGEVTRVSVWTGAKMAPQ